MAGMLRLKIITVLSLAFVAMLGTAFAINEKLRGKDMPTGKILTNEERAVVFGKATERPFSGKYDKFFDNGIYVCKVCGAPLYSSADKFDSGCGWPAFDDEFPNAVRKTPDADGERVEILCSRCGAHLGHIFKGERLTKKNVRHCVNSLSMDFIQETDIGRAIVAGGCFWGVEELMRKQKGVLSCISGYTGGTSKNPTYAEVCRGNSGHYEAVEILFDKKLASYEEILKYFFEIHDFTQRDGQGNDIGPQYESAVFYIGDSQKKTAEEIVKKLKNMGYDVATKILPAAEFFRAELWHQRYCELNKKPPHCHVKRKVF